MSQEGDQSRAPVGGPMPPAVKALLIANAAVFVAQMLLSGYGETDLATDWRLGLMPRRFGLWQLVTYMFLHDTGSPLHIFFNMLILWWAGSAVERTLGNRRFLGFYLATGVFAGICTCILDPREAAVVVGASGAIFGLLVAFALLFPNAVVYLLLIIPMRAWQLVLVLIVLETLSIFSINQSTIATFAHLGGAVAGFVLIRYGWVMRNALDRWETYRVECEDREDRRVRERVDELLAKVSREGLHKLTGSERAFLMRASKRYKKPER